MILNHGAGNSDYVDMRKLFLCTVCVLIGISAQAQSLQVVTDDLLWNRGRTVGIIFGFAGIPRSPAFY